MILPVGTSLKLVATTSLSASAAVHVDFIDWNSEGDQVRPSMFRSSSNHITDVSILPAPTGNNFVREPIHISVYNPNSATSTFIIKTDDGTAQSIIVQQAVTTGKSLIWEKTVGWYQI
jgi:hypothetical protein